MRGRTIPPNSKHEAFYQGVIALMKVQDLPPEEMLAVAANLVGKILALQNQHTMTPERGMEIVQRNIELGNAQAVSQIADLPAQGSA